MRSIVTLLGQISSKSVVNSNPTTSPKSNLFLRTLMLALGVVVSLSGWGQDVNTYSFNQSSGTYTAITGGTAHNTTATDNANYSFSLPFTFIFQGANYTTARPTTNGFLVLGGNAPSSSNYAPLSSGTTNFAISAFGFDLKSIVRSEVLGTAPNRIYVCQWSEAGRYNGGLQSDAMNFQIRLYETTNKIEIHFGSNTATTSSTNVQVGLRGSSNSVFNNRTSSTSWSTTNAGTVNTSTMSFSSSVNTTSGLIYSWSPPSPCAAPTSLAATPSSSTITNTSIAASFAAATTPPSGYIVIRTAAAGSQPALVNGTSYTVASSPANIGYIEYNNASAGSWTSSGLTSNTEYKYWVFSYNSTSCTGGPVYSATATTVNFSTTGCSGNALAGLSYGSPTATYCTSSAITANSATLTTTNSTYTNVYSVSPTLPAGLTLSSSTGQITGTPTAATAAANYVVTVNNGCTSTTATINITVLTTMSALTYSSNSPALCVGTAMTNLTATQTGGGTISYSAASLPAGLAISATTGTISGIPTTAATSANYTITATNACSFTTKVLAITINNNLSNATLTYGTTAASYCKNAAITANSISISPASNYAATTYSINPTVPGLSIGLSTGQITGTPTSAQALTYYTVTATSSCGTNTADLSITVNDLPSVSISSGSTFCPGGSAVTMTASGASTYSWSPNTNLTLTTGTSVGASPTTTTTYTVTGTDANGCVSTAQKQIVIGNPVTMGSVTASASSACAGSSVQLNGSASVGSALGSYLFSASSGIFTPLSGGNVITGANVDSYMSPALPIGFNFSYNGNSYSNFYFNSNGYIAFTSTIGTVNANSLLTATSPLLAPLWDDNDGGSGSASYLTTGTVGNRILTIEFLNWEFNYSANTAVISFQVKLYEASGKVEFVYRPEAGTVNTGSSGASIGITGATGTYLSLNNTSTSPSVSMTTSTNTILTKPANGQIYSFTPPSLTYAWSFTDVANALSSTSITNPIATVNATDTYTLIATGSDGCSASGNVSVALGGGTLSATATATSTAFCIGGSTTLSAPLTGGCSPFTYSWSDGTNVVSTASSFSANPTSTKTYTVTVTDNNSSTSTSSVTVTVNPLPTISVNNATFCSAGAAVALSASGASTYSWSPATGLSASTGSSVNASPTATTTYTVTGTDVNGCIATAQSIVTFTTSPPSIVATASSVTPCLGSTIDLSSTSGNIATSQFESFETFPPTGWTFVNAGSGNSWTSTSSYYKTGSKSLYYSFNSANAANAWAFTPAQSLTSGITYTISYWYRGSGTLFPENLKLTVGTGNTVASQTTTLATQANITTTTFTQVTVTFTPTVTGVYYFALNCYSAADMNYLAVDDFTISGFIPATYSWSSTPSGFSSSVQNPTGVTANETTTYIVTATANGCSTTSSIQTTVLPLPTASMSGTTTVCKDATAPAISFIGASGTAPYSFVYKINGGSNQTVTTSSGSSVNVAVPTSSAGVYTYDLISIQDANSCSQTQTDQEVVTVNQLVAITSQPINQVVNESANATFTVSTDFNSSNPGSVAYQWQESTDNGSSWTDLSSQTNATLVLNAVTSSMSGNKYRCIVNGSNGCSTITSNAVSLTISSVTISSQPADQTICSSGSATFEVVTSGGSATYQWEVSTNSGSTWAPISGETNSTLIVSNLAASNTGNLYHCRINDSFNSLPAMVTVYDAVVINAQPSTQTACLGSTSTAFSVSAGGSNLAYQWQVSTNGGTTWANALGSSTASTYAIASLTTAMDQYKYRVVVSGNALCSDVTSDAVLLNVHGVTLSNSATSNAICLNGSFNVSATPTTSAGTPSYNLVGTTGSGLTSATTTLPASITPTAAGAYTYTLTTTTSACTLTNTTVVTVNSLPAITSVTASPSTVCSGGTVSLSAASLQQSSGATSIGIGASAGSSVAQSVFPGSWGGTKSQYLIRASELTSSGLSAGNLTSIGFEPTTSGQTYQGFYVYVKTSNSTVLTGTFESLGTLVYVGTLANEGFTPTANVVNTLNFGTGSGTSSTFSWDGTSNLIVTFSWSRVPAATTATSSTMKYDVVSYTCATYQQADSQTPAAIRDIISGSTSTSRPKLIFGGQVTSNIAANLNWSWNTSPIVNAATGSVTETNNSGSATSQSYIVTATNPTTGCVNTATSNTVTINPLPVAPSATNSSQCAPGIPTGSVTSNTGATSPNLNWYTAATNGTLVLNGYYTGALSNYFTNDFSSNSGTGTLSGSASVTGGVLQLTPSSASSLGAITIPASGVNADKFNIAFNLITSAAANTGADGLSYSFGDDVSGTSTTLNAETGSGSKLKISFDAYGTSGNGVAGIRVIYGTTINDPGTAIGTNGVLAYNASTTWTNGNVPVIIDIDALGKLDLTVNGVTIFTDVQLPTTYLSADKSTWLHGFKARTGQVFMSQSIDNVLIKQSGYVPATTYQTSISTTTNLYVTETVGSCASPASQITFTVLTPPTVTVSPSTASICPGQSTSITASSNNSGYTYSWSNSLGTNATVSVSPTSTTTYTVTATDNSGGANNGCTTTGSSIVLVNPPSVLSIQPATICSGSTATLASSPVSTTVYQVGTGTSTSGASQTPYRQGISTESKVQYLIKKEELNSAGIYGPTMITSLGFNVVTLGSGAMPNYNITMSNTTASALTATYISGVFTNVFTATNLLPLTTGLINHNFQNYFNWDGTSNIVVNICHTGTNGTTSQVAVSTTSYVSTISQAAANQCSATSASSASNTTRPNMYFGTNNSSVITWTPTTSLFTNASTTNAYTSGASAATVYAKPTATTTYTATATSAAGCTSSTDVTVTVNPVTAISAQSTSAQTVCLNGTLNAMSVTASGTGTLTYQWYSNSSATNTGGTLIANATNASYTPPSTVAGTRYYYCVVTSTCGTATTNISGAIVVNTLPTVTASSNATNNTICSGSSVTLSGAGATSYAWNNNVTNANAFTPTTTTTYTVTGTDANGCSNTNSILVTVNALPTVTATASQEVCSGTSVTLAGSGASSYVWDNGITNNTAFNATSTETYTVTGTDANGCSNTATSTVTVIATPSTPVISSSTTTSCNAITLSSNVVAGNQWYLDGVEILDMTDETYDASASGSYTSIVTVNGCSSAASNALAITINSAVAITAQPTTATQNGVTGATVSVTATGSGLSYQWYANSTASNSGGTAISGANSASYSVSGLTANTYYYCKIAGPCNTLFSDVSGLVTGVPSTSISAAQCGNTIATTNTTVNATWVGSGTYRFVVSGGTLSSAVTLDKTWNGFQFSEVTGALPGNYSIAVSFKPTGQSTFGTVSTCSSITLGTNVPTTAIVNTQCGSTIPNTNTVVNCTWVGPGTYRFVVSGGTLGSAVTVDKSWNGFQFGDVTGALPGNYSVAVSFKPNGQSSFGSATTCSNIILGTNIPTTALVNTQCGSTITNTNTTVNCTWVGPGTYRFVVSGGNLSSAVTVDKSWNGFQFGDVSGALPGNYSVAVSFKPNGQSTFGTATTCSSITLGSDIPTTAISTSQCGTTIASTNTTVNCTWVGPGTYRFVVSGGNLPTAVTVDKTWNGFQFGDVTGALPGNYSVAVSFKPNGQSQFGGATTCSSITLGTSIPTTAISNSQCGTTIASTNTTVNCTWVGPGTYRFVVSGGNLSSAVTLDKTWNGFQFADVTGALPGNYSVAVSFKPNGQSQFGDATTCSSITLGTSIPTTGIVSTQCGTTIPTSNTVVNCTWVGPGTYRFIVSGGTLSAPVTLDKTWNGFQFSNISGASAGTYSISVLFKPTGYTSFGDQTTCSQIVLSNSQAMNLLEPQVLNQESEGVQTSEDATETTASVTETNPTTTWTATATSNPFATSFQIKLNGAEGVSNDASFTAQLTDMSGKVYSQATLTKEQLESESFGEQLAPGMYLMTLRQGEELRVIRVVKR